MPKLPTKRSNGCDRVSSKDKIAVVLYVTMYVSTVISYNGLIVEPNTATAL